MADRPAPIFGGRYQLRRRIARGGMAEVFLAHDRMLDRPVALKVLFPELSTDPNFVERFRREAQAAANLSHPNIVSIYDWGEEQGTYYIVMELVDGRPLSTMLKTEGPMLADRAADIGAAVASALAFAHKNGVVHRDVKPGNVLIDGAGNVKVADFGIARAKDSVDDNLTQTGAVMGTATYFSPEQAQGFGVDARSDIYSLGVMLYEMVCGKPPFTGSNPVAVATKHVSDAAAAAAHRQPEPVGGVRVDHPHVSRQGSRRPLRDRRRFARRPRALPPRPRRCRRALRRQGRPERDTTRWRATRAQRPARGATTPPRSSAPSAACRPRSVAGRGSMSYCCSRCWPRFAGLLFLLAKEVGIVGAGGATQVEVPNVLDRSTGEAAKSTARRPRNLKVNVVEENNAADPEIVFDQDPQGGRARRQELRSHHQGVDRPHEGHRRRTSSANNATRPKRPREPTGFTRADRGSEADDSAADRHGLVARTRAGGSQAPEGSTVTITVSSGEQTSQVPERRRQERGRRRSTRSTTPTERSRSRRVHENFGTVDKGEVIRTDPPAGSDAAKGATVTIVDVRRPRAGDGAQRRRQDRSRSARRVAHASRLQGDVEHTSTPLDNADDGTVIDQSPNSGRPPTRARRSPSPSPTANGSRAPMLASHVRIRSWPTVVRIALGMELHAFDRKLAVGARP